jgi:hypothetical protein
MVSDKQLTIPWKRIVISVIIILLDLFLGIVLGVLLMDYDDFYQESLGEYGSWASMNNFQKLVSVGLQLWWISNVIVIGYIIYRMVKRRKMHYSINQSNT